MKKTCAFRASACLIVALILSPVPGRASTNQVPATAADYENVARLCDRLTQDANDQKAALEIATFARRCPVKDLAGKLVGAYACTRLLAGDSAGFTSTLKYLRQNLADVPEGKLLDENQFFTRCDKCDGKGTSARACQKCNGTSRCSFCGGSGVGKGKGFEGKELACIGCGGKGQCKSCGGTGNTTAQCTACRGSGKVLSKDMAEGRLHELLASAKDMAFDQAQTAKGLVKYEGKWVTSEELARISAKAKEVAFEQEQADKGLVKIEGKWVKPEAHDPNPPEREKASPTPQERSLDRQSEDPKTEPARPWKGEAGTMEPKTEKEWLALLKESRRDAGDPITFVVRRKLSEEDFSDAMFFGVTLALRGNELYDVEIIIGTHLYGNQAMLLTTETTFTSTGQAQIYIVYERTVEVTLRNGFTKKIPLLREADKAAVDAYHELSRRFTEARKSGRVRE